MLAFAYLRGIRHSRVLYNDLPFFHAAIMYQYHTGN
jgi:hypothetical protein